MIKLIRRGIKKNKKSFIGLFSCITITTMVLVLLICFFSSEGYTDYINTKEKVGTYNYLIDTVTEFEAEHNSQFVTMNDSNTIYNYGNFKYGIMTYLNNR